MKYMLAIDQGTTSTRAIIFDHESNLIAVAPVSYTHLHCQLVMQMDFQEI